MSPMMSDSYAYGIAYGPDAESSFKEWKFQWAETFNLLEKMRLIGADFLSNRQRISYSDHAGPPTFTSRRYPILGLVSELKPSVRLRMYREEEFQSSMSRIFQRLLIAVLYFSLGACATGPTSNQTSENTTPPGWSYPEPFESSGFPGHRGDHGGGRGGGGHRGGSPPPVRLARPPEMSPLVTQNAYELLTARDAENCNPTQNCYAIYTYVILPRKVGGDASGLDAEIRQRYQATLTAITGLSNQAKDLESAGVSKNQINVFCIPVIREDAKPAVENYNWELGVAYLVSAEALVLRTPTTSALSTKFAAQMHSNSGPFLVSTPLPMDQLGDRSAVLVTDLSRYHAGALEQLIAEYERRIEAKTSDPLIIFNPLKVRLLSIAQYANEDVEIELVQLAKFYPKGSGND
jgi:hypothetical protein